MIVGAEASEKPRRGGLRYNKAAGRSRDQVTGRRAGNDHVRPTGLRIAEYRGGAGHATIRRSPRARETKYAKR